MKVIVIGAGKVGRTIIENICKEGHEVVVIDNNANNIENIVETYDVGGLCGNGVSYEVQKNAGVDKADLVIAVTPGDEANILSCVVAKKLGAKHTIARVRNYEYKDQTTIFKNDLGINMTINPEEETMKEIMRIISFPEALKVDTFSRGKVELIELFIPNDSPLIGKTLSSISQDYKVKVLSCAVQREDEVIIPSGNFVFEAKDRIHITADKNNASIFFQKLGLLGDKIKNVLIIGGGKISVYLGQKLIDNKYNVKIIEKDYNKCLELSQLLPDVTIIHGDGSDMNVLNEEGLHHSDVIISLTGLDEENLIISMYAAKEGVHKIITKINKSSFIGLIETLGTASVVSPKEITAAHIVRYIRAVSNERGSNVIKLYKLINNKVEAIEFIAKENKKLLNIPLKELKLKSDTLIAGIIRDNEAIIPNGNDVIKLNDSVIVITMNNEVLNDLNDILG